ncbi:preprotein translocase subunit YajC [Lacticaseibacillus suihuaensis]
MIIVLVLMFGFMYFGMMRPQKKQQQKRQAMLNAMKKGDKVVTIGGLHAVVDSINEADQTVDLDVDGVFLTFNRSAIRTINDAGKPAAAKPAAKKEETEDAKNDDKGYSEDDK